MDSIIEENIVEIYSDFGTKHDAVMSFKLSPKSDQHQISPCIKYQCFVKQSGHENHGHDHTR